jgi:hypothetical protein
VAASNHKVVKKRMFAIAYRSIYKILRKSWSEETAGEEELEMTARKKGAREISRAGRATEKLELHHCNDLPISSSTRIHPPFGGVDWLQERSIRSGTLLSATATSGAGRLGTSP